MKKVALKNNFMRWEGPWLKPKVDQSGGTHTMALEMWRPLAHLLWILVHVHPCSLPHPHGEDRANAEAKLAKPAERYNNMPPVWRRWQSRAPNHAVQWEKTAFSGLQECGQGPQLCWEGHPEHRAENQHFYQVASDLGLWRESGSPNWDLHHHSRILG